MAEDTRPAWTRGSLARGLKAAGGGAPAVDREKRVIRGASLVTRGEALGHGFWLDSQFLDQAVKAGRAGAGIKARFTHPGLCSDGMGKYLGRWRNLARDGERVRGDLFLAESASKSPDGDLAGYVMSLAEEDPEAFGASIVFEHDGDAEQAFAEEHKVYDDEAGRKLFKSPDADNPANLPHARLSELRTADVVDEPAANPDGLFSRGADLARRAEAFLDWALSGQGPAPELEPAFGIEAERARDFLNSYLTRRNVRLAPLAGGPPAASAPKEDDMAEDKKEATAPDKGPDVAALQAEAKAAGRKEERGALEQLLAAFPKDRAFALESFAKGLSLDQAKAAQAELLAAEVEQLKKKCSDLEAKAPPPPPPAGKAAGFAEGSAPSADFLSASRALAAEKGLDLAVAMAQIAREQPELHRAYLGLGAK